MKKYMRNRPLLSEYSDGAYYRAFPKLGTTAYCYVGAWNYPADKWCSAK